MGLGARASINLKWAFYVLGVGALLYLPHAVRNQYYMQIMIIAAINVIPALGLNLLMGVTGQLSLCQAAFYGIGAYTSALLMMNLGFSFWASMPASAVLSGLIGILLGIPALRFRGHYLLMVTWGFNVIVYEVLLNWISLTRGPMGLIGIPSPGKIDFFGIFAIDFSSRRVYYYLVIAAVAFTIFIMRRVHSSRIGTALMAIREDEVAAEVLGVDTRRYKVMAFGLSAFFGGLGGAFFAHYLRTLTPDSFTFVESVNFILMMIIGGAGSTAGVVVGAVFLTTLSEYLRFIVIYRMVTYGALLVFLIIFFPEGIAGGARSAVALARRLGYRLRGSGGFEIVGNS